MYLYDRGRFVVRRLGFVGSVTAKPTGSAGGYARGSPRAPRWGGMGIIMVFFMVFVKETIDIWPIYVIVELS